jgi:hypothetical protein
MAKFGERFLSSLTTPGYELTGVGKAIGEAPERRKRVGMFNEAMETGDYSKLNPLIMQAAARSGDPMAMAQAALSTRKLTESSVTRQVNGLELQRSQLFNSGDIDGAKEVEKQMAELLGNAGMDPSGVQGRTASAYFAGIKQQADILNNQATLVTNDLETIARQFGIDSEQYQTKSQMYINNNMGEAVSTHQDNFLERENFRAEQLEKLKNNEPLSEAELKFLVDAGADEGLLKGQSNAQNRRLYTNLKTTELGNNLKSRAPIATKLQAQGHVDFALDSLAKKYDYISFAHNDLREDIEEEMTQDDYDQLYGLVINARPEEVEGIVEDWLSKKFKDSFAESKKTYEYNQTVQRLQTIMIKEQAIHKGLLTEDQDINELDPVERRIIENEIKSEMRREQITPTGFEAALF